ncbi:MAG TPA: FAD-dependent oxidoreductase [Synergistaceae bacterium]|nr:FAD-dependent oxidoreductase [Synergistaceae bacterium]
MGKNVVIIGGVACGSKVAARLRRLDPEASITVLERGYFPSYAGCGMPYFLGGVVSDYRHLTSTPVGIERDAAFFRKVKHVDMLTRHEATRIDRERRVVTAIHLESGEERIFPYDVLVLSLGAQPVRPNLPGRDLAGVFSLGTMEDARAISRALEEGTVGRAVVVGSGLIGLEMTEALKNRGVEVSVVELLDRPLGTLLDRDFGALVAQGLERHGVPFFGGERVVELVGEGGRVATVRTDRRDLPADLVLLAVGVRPSVDLAREAGLTLGPSGGIMVDEHLRTNDDRIYAGGDCVEVPHILSGKSVRQPMGSAANRQGRVIADHIAGLPGRYAGVAGTAIARIFDLTAARTGLDEAGAREAGFDPVGVTVVNSDMPHFMPGSALLALRLVADRSTRRVLGGQVVGLGRGDKRLDALVASVTGKITVDDLADLDLGYAPPFSTALDPLTHGANVLRNKLDGLMDSWSPAELLDRKERGEPFLLVDVRTPDEVRLQGRLPFDDQVNIPLGALWEKGDTLPGDRTLVVFCKISVRGWDAYGILRNKGFGRVVLLEGGTAGWPYGLKG